MALDRRVNNLATEPAGISSIKPKSFGFKIAGQKNRRNRNPLTEVNSSIEPSPYLKMACSRILAKTNIISGGQSATELRMASKKAETQNKNRFWFFLMSSFLSSLTGSTS
eukprot:Lithocolla_globosa_v1_NODE_1858_length_2292_cov_13.453286.p2 type:complete len:110 gc:universal NODE_1858_length_2292_cov_13.453286:1849-1520(-)